MSGMAHNLPPSSSMLTATTGSFSAAKQKLEINNNNYVRAYV